MTTALHRRHEMSRSFNERFGITPGRKTAVKVEHRRDSFRMPPWRARFVLPESVGFAVTPGPVTGLVGASVITIGRCLIGEVVGRKKDWVLRQADALASALGHYRRPLHVRITRDAEAGILTSAPFDRGDDQVVEIGRCHIVEGGAMRALAIEESPWRRART